MDQSTDAAATRLDATAYELDWEAVEPRDEPASPPRDVLGLTRQDRAALGMTTLRVTDVAPMPAGDATEALREAILHGASYGKTRR